MAIGNARMTIPDLQIDEKNLFFWQVDDGMSNGGAE